MLDALPLLLHRPCAQATRRARSVHRTRRGVHGAFPLSSALEGTPLVRLTQPPAVFGTRTTVALTARGT